MIDKESHTAQMIRQDLERALGIKPQSLLHSSISFSEKEIDYIAGERFNKAQQEKLAEKREEGRGRWWDSTVCSQKKLSEMLREHVEKGDPIDVANLCMMLFARGEKIL